MTTSNIDQFDLITGKVLGTLYGEFPVPVTLNAEQFVEPATRYCEHVDADVPSKEAEFFTACVLWLAEAGYLRVREQRHGWVRDTVLTAKGLEVLKATPASLQTGPSLGEQLAQASKAGTAEVMRGVVGEALSMGARLFSHQLGLPG